MRISSATTAFLFTVSVLGSARAQEMNPTAQQPSATQQPQAQMRDGVPVYRVEVVGRDIPAINYFHRSGSTRIGFQGTSLLSQGKGEASVKSERGRMTIDAKLEGLVPANSFGQEYLTYVLWAITPDGRPINLGEVLPQGSKTQITVTTDLQAYGLIITAEPYFAVTMPSDLVVMQNFVLPDRTQGIIEQVNAHATLLPRGAYVQTAGQHAVLHPITRDDKSPLELYEAINAVQIAQANGADKYAPEAFQKAQQDLTNAQDISKKSARKEQITYAREAVQGAEDARIITIRKKQEEDKQQAQEAKEAAQQAAFAAQQAADQQALRRAQADADAARAQAQAAQAQAAQRQAEQSAQQASQQTEQMRERLKDQLNQVLQTRETARGLIVNMSDVLFGFNQYNLQPEAREKLAKVSGILLAYPNLQLQVEGYTDNVGSDDYNQKLSQQRADAVRDYLTSQGVSSNNISSTGYGKSDPVADNSTNQGRAENRRVQLVVSGNSIGVQESAPSAQAQPQATPAPQPAQSTGVSNPPNQ
ncbi:Outer membrane protein A precursor [Acidisarcina polymorpha]|uniref:Outer membrane protein A n=1 Tax=Acidisarcina polymorpha TaxID=2211140 RepID=A0A2Z5FUS7_9BACT|nr:OmpA family protein [Acidisarcina polymorpha]AXC10500.1 Outer membrane protein A precursor [Acidisarcina polymorpha]